MEFVEKYRPEKLKQVVGQKKAITTLQALLNKKTPPQVFMFMGPSGCGKTTIARIVAHKLGAIQIAEMNMSDYGGIDYVRSIRDQCQKYPISTIHGTRRAWIIDECHGLSKDAQNAFLKILEEPPSHALFLFCTTDPMKMIEPLMQRCNKIKLEKVGDDCLKELVQTIIEKEKLRIPKKVLPKIIEASNGSPRNAVKLLEQVSSQKSESAMHDCLVSTDIQAAAIEICRALISRRPWSEIRKLVETVKEESETVRRIILGYMSSIALTGSGQTLGRALEIGQMLLDSPWYEGKPAMVFTIMTLCAGKK